MLKAIYPGSFDPVTKGHLDIIERSAKLADTLIVGVLENPHKRSLFTVQERVDHLKMVTEHIENVQVEFFQGLLVDFARKMDAKVVIRGLRAVTDFESEFQMALINKSMNPDVETLFISTCTKYLAVSSSTVKEIASFGGEIDSMVPEQIKQIVMDKYKK